MARGIFTFWESFPRPLKPPDRVILARGKMEIRFFKPFDEIAGTSLIRIKIPSPIPVRDLLKRVEAELPSFQPYVKREGDEVQNFFAVLVREGEILKLDDPVKDEDVVKVFPPISGG
jgi:sulfur-carrier protein